MKIYISPSREYDPESTVPLAGMQSNFTSRKRRFCNYFCAPSPRAEMHMKIYISPSREYYPAPTIPLAEVQPKFCIPASGGLLLNFFLSRLRKCTESCAFPRAEMRSGCCISASRKCKRMCAVPQAVLHIKRSKKIVPSGVKKG